MRKHPWIYLLFLATLVLFASACNQLPNTEPDRAALGAQTASPTRQPTQTATPTEVIIQGTVSIWHPFEEPHLPALLKTIAAFQEQYPNVYFDVTYVPLFDLRSSFEQAALAGGGPTILIAPGEWGPAYYEQALIADLSDLAEAELLNTLTPPAVDAVRYQDGLIGLPLYLDGVVLFRNMGLIPISPATFDELVSLAESVSSGETYGAYLDRSFFFSGGHLSGLGGTLMTPEGEPAFNNLEGLEWINLLISFERAGPVDFFTDNDLNAFKEGRVGMIIDGTWHRNDLAQAIGEENLAIDPWPIHADGSLSGYVQTHNVYLSPRALSEEQAISWKFVEFLLSPESQRELAEVGLIPSLNGSPVSLAGGAVQINDRLIKEAMLAFVEGTAYPITPEMSNYVNNLDIALRSIFEDAFPADLALQNAEQAIIQSMVEMEATATPTP